MNTLCCEKCEYYWVCETKWYRGEKGEEQVCCPKCRLHKKCTPQETAKKK